jgi:hypothetical protein
MPGSKTFSVRSLTKETDFQKVIATGKESLRIYILKYLMNEAYGVDSEYSIKYSSVSTPTLRAAYDDVDELEDASSNFFGVEHSSNTQPMEFLLDVVAQARTFMRSAARGVWPDLASSSALLAFLALEVRQALLDQPHTQTQEDMATAGTTLTNILEGISWSDDGLSTNDMHCQWLRRLVYIWALSWTGKLPNLAQNIAATQAMTVNMNRIVDVITCLIVFEIFYFFLIGYVQSDRAMFNVGFLGYELAKLKTHDEMATALDPIWEHFAKQNKIGYMSAMSNHSAWTADFIDQTEIEANTLDSTIDRLSTSFIVSQTGLKMARSLFGIGNYKDGEHFAFLLNGTPASGDGAGEYHGLSDWMIGVNSAIVMRCFEEMKGWNEEINSAIMRNKHYTFLELKDLISSYFTEFDFVSSVKGICDNEVYWGLRRNLTFADNPISSALLETEVVRDPQAVHDTNVLLPQVADASFEDWAGIPIAPLIFLQGRINPRNSLMIPADVTEAELGWDIIIWCLTALTSSTDWQDQRYEYNSTQLVSFIDYKTDELVDLALANANVVRWDFRINPNEIATYPSAGAKYLAGLIEGGYEGLTRYESEARPHDWKDKHMKVIDFFTEESILRYYARLAIHHDSSSAPSDVTVTPTPSNKPPVASKPSDEDEELI